MQAALIIRFIYSHIQIQSFKNRSEEKMSLKGRLLAAALAAATVFSSAFTGTVNAAGPMAPDPSVQESSGAGTSAEEPIREDEPGQEEEPVQGSDQAQGSEPAQGEGSARDEEENEGTDQADGGRTSAAAGEAKAPEEEPREEENAPSSGTQTAEQEIRESEQENEKDQETVQEEPDAAATDMEAARETEPGVSASGDQGENRAETGSLAVNIDSCGGTVTIYDGEKVYTMERAQDLTVSVVDEEGRAVRSSDERYDFIAAREIGKRIRIRASADKGCKVRSFTVTGSGKGVDETTFDPAKAGTGFEQVVVIGEGQKTVNVSFDTMPSFTAEKKAGKYVVKISAGKGVFPEGTKAEVKEISGNDAKPYVRRAEEMADSGVVTAVIDIRFTDRSGKEIQPEGMVDVVFENAAEEDSRMSVYHAENGSAAAMENVPCSVDGDKIEIKNDSFSPYVLMAAAGEPDWTKGGRGTERNISKKISLVHRNQKVYKYADKGYDGAGNDWLTISYDLYLNGKKVGTGVCLDPLHSGWEMEGTTAGSVYEIDAPMMVKALYYGADGPGRSVIEKATGTADTNALRIVTHVAASELYVRLGYARHSSSGEGFRDASNKLKDHVYKFVKAIEDLPVPDNFYAYITADNGYASNGLTNQDFGVGAYSLIEHPGFMNIRKKSANPSLSDGNSCYSYNGALYQVYTSEAAAKARGTEGMVDGLLFVLDEHGESNTKRIMPGKYYLIETRTAKGYLLSDKVYPFTVVDNKTVEVEVTDVPANDPTGIVINKSCKDADDTEIRSLEGTQFTVSFYDGFYDASSLPQQAARTWVIETKKTENGLYKASLDEKHLVSGDEFYTVGGKITLPLGTVTIRETKPAPGYVNDGKFGDHELYIGQIRKTDDHKAEMTDIQGKRATSNSFEVSDTPMEPQIGTSAVNAANGARTACAGEEVTIEDTVTYHNLIAGEEYVMSGNLVDKETGEVILDAEGKEVTAETKFTAEEDGGTVMMAFTFKADVSMEGRSAVVFETVKREGKTVAEHADPDDEAQTIHFPKIVTTAENSDTKDHQLGRTENARITDKVTYGNLIPGREYKLRGVLMKKTDGSALTADGKEAAAEKTFTPDEADGETELTFTCNTEELHENGIVVYEELYDGECLIAYHKDINDPQQSVFLPTVTTDACDGDTGKQNMLAAKDRVIVDRITYSGLIAGKTYEISGEVKIKSDGTDFDNAETVPSKITGAEGKGSISYDAEKVTFIPDGSEGEPVSGEILVSFAVDASGLEGEDLVAGESVRYKGVDLAVHRDLDDEKQTVHIPRGRTYAVDAQTGIKTSLAAENRVFKDEFTYENLLPGETYRFTGRVMAAAGEDDRGGAVVEEIPSVMTDENGNALENGCIEFVPASKDGTLDLYFAIDASSLANRDVTVYETVTLGGEPVIVHEALDGSQTVYIPDGATTVVDLETGERIANADEEARIMDTLVYRNLIPGKEYTVAGRVMKKSTCEEIPSSLIGASFRSPEGEEGKDQSSGQISVMNNTVTFTPDSGDGTLELIFAFDARSLAGENAVVFERVYHDGSEVIVHENIDDEAQTVHFPRIRTAAADEKDSDQRIDHKGTVGIVDEIKFENLLAGAKYRVTGVLMDKSAGKPALAGGKEISGETAFTPEKPDGSVEVIFRFNSSQLRDGEYVAFETLCMIKDESGDEYEVGSHRDLRDKEQTVKRQTPPGETRTGDGNNTGIWIMLLAAAAAGTAGTLFLRKRKADE